MSRATSKQDLMAAATQNYDKLQALISTLKQQELSTPFDFSRDPGKKEAHWQRDKNLRDILIHLFEWHQLILNWVHANRAGQAAPFLPPPYNWKSYGQMNVGFWEKHQGTSLSEAKELFENSHQQVMALAAAFSDQQLFTKDAFPWVGGSTLGAYFVSVTASHYDWAIKKLKAHQKNCRD